ncbi:hypothetical protein [Austwickia chelonae]|uniref:hypothetical protein n=1 Tax=Austwickia chelonae TaxID=100225 RepID=UPI0013C3695D|nr:hypothetical protein [Austwickia chelonae]
MLTVAILSSVIAGCSGESERQLTADHPVFAGITPDIVDETISFPGVADQYKNGRDEQISAQMAQARAYDLIACRSAYQAYVSWQRTGEPGKIDQLPSPTKKTTEGFSTINAENDERIELIRANDIEGFRNSMTGELKCGREIPVKPKDYKGQTIEQALLAAEPQENR